MRGGAHLVRRAPLGAWSGVIPTALPRVGGSTNCRKLSMDMLGSSVLLPPRNCSAGTTHTSAEGHLPRMAPHVDDL